MSPAPPTADLPFERAIDVFLRGFSLTRSFTHPYVLSTLAEGVWLLQDAPRRSGERRSAEVTVWQQEPAALAALLRERVSDRHSVCVMTEARSVAEAEPTADAYRRAGYHLQSREELFVADTAGAPADGGGDRVVAVTEPALAAAVNKASRSHHMAPKDAADPNSTMRLFAALDDAGGPVGWARSVRTHDDCAWVSSVYVEPAHRNQGLGRALMHVLLADDARRGIRHSVLLASNAGARLYPRVGYRQIGLLLLFRPPKSA
jgi:predicted GNAT family acetyltransferase